MRIIDVEKALSEIGSNMSVTFYAHDGNDYYILNNWNIWQRVDKPQPSKIPDPTGFTAHSGIVPDSFQNDSCLKERKRIEEEKEKKKKNYCTESTSRLHAAAPPLNHPLYISSP